MNPDPGSGSESGSAFSFQVGSGSGSAKKRMRIRNTDRQSTIFWNIPRFYWDIKNKVSFTEIWSIVLPCRMQIPSPIYQPCYKKIMKGSKCESANNFWDKPRNLSSFITECRSLETFKIILERHQHIERRIFFRVHKIAHPKKEMRYSNFSDSVQYHTGNPVQEPKATRQRDARVLLIKEYAWSLLHSLSTTMSHWSSGLTVCFLPQGARFVPRGCNPHFETGITCECHLATYVPFSLITLL